MPHGGVEIISTMELTSTAVGLQFQPVAPSVQIEGNRRAARQVSCTISVPENSGDLDRALMSLCDDLAAIAVLRCLAEEHAEPSRYLRPVLDGSTGRQIDR
jgi:hypothetical protein